MSEQQAIVTGPIPVLPRAITFFKDNPIDPHNYSWNLVTLLEVQQSIDPSLLRRAVRRLLLHHDALRLRFVETDTGWQQHIAAPDEAIPCQYYDLSLIPQEAQRNALEAAVAQIRVSLNLSTGPLCRVVLFDLGSQQPQRLLVLFHHLAADQYSFSILLEDLHTAYAQLSRGQPVRLPVKTSSIKGWAEALVAYAKSAAIRRELDYWLSLPWFRIRPLPLDFPAARGTDIEATSAILAASLDTSQTHLLLHELPKAGTFQVRHVVLAALLQALKDWTGHHTLLIETVQHGRNTPFDDIDLSRTVGWYTTHTQMLVDLHQAETSRDLLQSVTAQVQAIPNAGMGYELLRYFSQDAELAGALQEQPRAEVMLNYYPESTSRASSALGTFRPAQESVEAGRNLQNRRYKLVEITATIADGQFVTLWSYSTRLYRSTTIEALSRRFLEIIHALIGELAGGLPLRE